MYSHKLTQKQYIHNILILHKETSVLFLAPRLQKVRHLEWLRQCVAQREWGLRKQRLRELSGKGFGNNFRMDTDDKRERIHHPKKGETRSVQLKCLNKMLMNRLVMSRS